MIKKILAAVTALAIIISSGLYIREQGKTINELNERLVTIEVVREKETLHYDREADRQDALRQLLLKTETFNREAETDVSDKESKFGASRTYRLNQVR